MNDKETKEIEDFRGFENKVFKQLEIWRGKLTDLKEKVKQINDDKSILVSAFSEINKKTNIKLNNLLHDIELQEEISYLNDWVGFYSRNIEKYELKLNNLKKIIDRDSIEDLEKEQKKEIELFKFIFKETEEKPIKNFKNIIKEIIFQKPLVKYGIPLVILLLIISGLFLLKPSFTAYVALGKETTYNESLNLKINESGRYNWTLNKPGDLKSVKATGSVVGNGTVKVYIEKDGKRYLIYSRTTK